MKRCMYVMLVLLFVGGQVSLMAQDNEKKRQRPTQEQVMQWRVQQMVEALMLDDDTAAQFTTVYQNYLKELNECRRMNFNAQKQTIEAKSDEKKPVRKASMTDEEIAKMLQNQFEQSRKLLDIREKYYAEFSKILTQKQILKLYNQEKRNADKFKKEFNRRKDMKADRRTAEPRKRADRGFAPQPDNAQKMPAPEAE